MSLKLIDALRLSLTGFTQHKGSSALVVVTITLLFSCIMIFNFIVSGLEKTALLANASQTDGKVFIASWIGSSSTRRFIQKDDVLEKFETEMNNTELELIQTQAKRFNGKIIGEAWMYQFEVPYNFISQNLGERFTNEILPQDTIPVLVPKDENSPLGSELSIVGTIPSTDYRNSPEEPNYYQYHPILPDNNPLNYFLKMVYGGQNDALLIDNSGISQEFITQKIQQDLNQAELLEINVPKRKIIIEFDNISDALQYSKATANSQYHNDDFLGGILSTANSFQSFKDMVLILEIIFVVAAVIIATFTFRHLLIQDTQTIILYQIMGASRGNLYSIYFLYLLELCVLAIAACLLFSFLVIGLLTILSASSISMRLQEFYRLDISPKVYFWKLDQYFWTIVLVILLVAPLTLVFSTHYFTMSYLAKHLKER